MARFSPYYRNALLGSLLGASVFGLLMSALGMMPMIGMLVNTPNAVVGWFVHLGIGTLFAIPFAAIMFYGRGLPATLLGIPYGIVVWVAGALVIMPLWLGMPEAVFNLSMAGPWWSLAGHIVYGLTAGLVADALRPRDVVVLRAAQQLPL